MRPKSARVRSATLKSMVAPWTWSASCRIATSGSRHAVTPDESAGIRARARWRRPRAARRRRRGGLRAGSRQHVHDGRPRRPGRRRMDRRGDGVDQPAASGARRCRAAACARWTSSPSGGRGRTVRASRGRRGRRAAMWPPTQSIGGGADDGDDVEQLAACRDQAVADLLRRAEERSVEVAGRRRPSSRSARPRRTRAIVMATATTTQDHRAARRRRSVGDLVEGDDHDLGGQDEVGADRSGDHRPPRPRATLLLAAPSVAGSWWPASRSQTFSAPS